MSDQEAWVAWACKMEAERDQLRALVREAMPFVNDAGDDEDPEAKAVACEWLEKARPLLKADEPEEA
jgi:hypothetical protein